MTQRIEFVIGTAKLYALVETFTADGEREGRVLSIHSRGSGNELPLKLLTREREVDLIAEALALEDQDSLWTTSKSGRGLHLYVVLSEGLREGERLALQAALGSDPMRELLSTIRHLLRVAADDPFDPKLQEPSVLFETKAEAGRVTEFLDRHPVRERVVREGT